MRYEPVGYIYEYELGALAVFLVIMLRYFMARRFPNQKNRLYSLVLWTTVANVVLDGLSSYNIDHILTVPVTAVYVVNSLFYAVSVLMLVLMMIYACALRAYIGKNLLWKMTPLMIPGIVILLLLISNPFTHWFFYIDPNRGYIHAGLFWLIYAVCFVYLLLTLAIVLKSRAHLRKQEFRTILCFLSVVFLSTVVQYLIPILLITGVATMLAVVLMFFTIQNPDTMVDMTTGAFTYEAMLTFLRDRMQEQDCVQLAAVKIHNMSRINELIGVENGSLMLRQLFRFIGSGTNDAWVFRMRGSCFVSVTRQKKEYTAIRSRLEKRIAEPFLVNGTEVLLQATLCCLDTEELLAGPIPPEEAVLYLETAFSQTERDAGRIRTVDVGKDLMAKIKRDSAVEAALRKALVSGEGLELFFQPLWSIQQKRFVSAEVLLRFSHPELGFIPPDEFVTIAENNGFITALDEFVVRKACAFMEAHKYLKDLGIDTLEVNLSALEFMHRRLPDVLRDTMKQYNIDPQFLCFEVTETAATESFQLLQSCMTDIMQLGCRFALDDFGTGYANISQVIQLPFSTVKLDKSMLYGPSAVLEDLVRMFERIERKTVIEGVETAAQVEAAKRYGADVIQGFYYAKPMNEKQLIRFLQNQYELNAVSLSQ